MYSAVDDLAISNLGFMWCPHTRQLCVHVCRVRAYVSVCTAVTQLSQPARVHPRHVLGTRHSEERTPSVSDHTEPLRRRSHEHIHVEVAAWSAMAGEQAVAKACECTHRCLGNGHSTLFAARHTLGRTPTTHAQAQARTRETGRSQTPGSPRGTAVRAHRGCEAARPKRSAGTRQHARTHRGDRGHEHVSTSTQPRAVWRVRLPRAPSPAPTSVCTRWTRYTSPRTDSGSAASTRATASTASTGARPEIQPRDMVRGAAARMRLTATIHHTDRGMPCVAARPRDTSWE